MKPRIVILERIHDAGLKVLNEFSSVDFQFDSTAPALHASLQACDAVVVKSRTVVDEAFVAAAPRLRAIGRAGTGIDNIDVAAAERAGIKVLTSPRGNSVSTAEFTVLLMLSICRRLKETQERVAAHDYRRHLLEGHELAALTVGLIGLGNVGTEVARRLVGFGCHIVGYDPRPAFPKVLEELGIAICHSPEDVIRQADLLSFHVRLAEETRNMLNPETLALARPGLLLVNTSRGAVIDETALLQALDSGKVAAAALDVLKIEPPFDAEPNEHEFLHPLVAHPHVLATPHLAASTVEAQQRIATNIADQLREVLVGAS